VQVGGTPYGVAHRSLAEGGEVCDAVSPYLMSGVSAPAGSR